MTDQHAAPDLLLVCHANRARSPLAAHLLRAWADEHGVRPRPRIASSGLYAEPGQPLLPDAREFLRETRAVDDSTHQSRVLEVAEARSAGLVVTFERALLRSIIARDPALATRTFTLREVVRLTSSPLWESGHDARDLAAHLVWLRPRVAPGDDDSPDPAGASRRTAHRLLESLAADVATAAPVLLGQGHSWTAP